MPLIIASQRFFSSNPRMRPLAVAVALVVAAAPLDKGAAQKLPPPAVDVRDLPPLPRDVAGEDVGNVAIVAATEAEEDVVSGAAKRDQSLGSVASAVTVISGDRLRRFGYRTVAEALRAVAGVYIVDDRISERVGIRGLQILGDFNTHVLVLVDGITVNEPWNQYVGIGADMPVSIDEIARIEVIRGPVSSVYGTNAFFGILNVVTRRAEQSPRASARFTGGTFGTIVGNVSAAAGNVNRQIRGNVSFLRRAGETITIPELGGDGKTSADGNLAYQASIAAEYDGAFLQARGYNKEREIAAAPYDTAPGDPDNRFIDRQLLVEAGYTRELGERVTLTGRGYFQRYQFQDYLVYSPDSADFRDIGNSLWIGGELRGFMRLLRDGKLDLTLGAEAVWNDVTSEAFFTDDRAGGINVPTKFTVFGLYGEVTSEITSWLGASAGARFDHNSQFTSNVAPRAALLFHKAEDFGLKLLFADGFRFPSSYEAFFADNKDFIANPALDPERIRSFEAVVWARPVPGLSLRLSGFRWELEDIIELNEVEREGMDPVLQFQNIFAMTSMGVELEASYRDVRGWMGAASLTWADVERNEGMEPAANAPALVAKVQASTPLIAKIFHLSSEVQVVSERESRDPMVTAPAFVGWNAVIYVPDVKRFDLTLGVRNLIGTREKVPTSDEVDRGEGTTPVFTVPGEGRELFFRLGYSY
jgi:outer membrane receptor for ferrienterochelin and colicins